MYDKIFIYNKYLKIKKSKEKKMENNEKHAYEKPVLVVQKNLDEVTWGQEPPMGNEPD